MTISPPDGAFQIGGGEWSFGQGLTEQFTESLFKFDSPNPLNMLELLRQLLERLPLEALKGWQGLIGGADALFEEVGSAVDAIIDALGLRPVFMLLGEFTEWLGDVFDPLFALFNQVLDILQGNVVVPINEVISNIVDWFAGLPSIASVAEAIAAALGDSFEAVMAFFSSITNWSTWSTALQTIIDGLLSVTNLSTWTALLKQVIDFFGTVTNFPAWSAVFKQVVDFFGTITNFSTWSGVLKQITDFFAGISDAARPFWLDILDDIVTFFASLTSFSGWTSVLKTLIDGLLGITNFSTWVSTFKTLVDGLLNITNFSAWVSTFKTLVDGLLGIGSFSAWVGVLKQVIDFFNTITAGVRGAFLTSIKTVVEFFQGVIGSFGSLPAWLGRLPSLAQDLINDLWSLLNGGAEGIGRTINEVLTSIGTFVAQLVEALTSIPGALGLGQVATWANNLLHNGLTWPDFRTLFGDVPAAILGVLPIPNISMINPELMSQGGFNTSTTLAPGSGWTWDAWTQSGSGGSAKVAGAATTRQLYSNQSVEVAEGDKLIISCWVKSTGTVGANGIVLSIVEFNGTTTGTTRTIASRASSASPVQIGNSAGAPYVVGAGVTSIRVRLAITSAAASGSFVWFDNISVKKTGLLSGDWMEGILGTVAEDIQATVDGIILAIQQAGGAGNPLTGIRTAIESIFTTLFGAAVNFLPPSLLSNPLLAAAIPGLDGSKINDGVVNADFLPMDDIGSEINPAAGSGALLVRTTNGAVAAGANGFNLAPNGFFNSLQVSSTDIQCLRSNGTAGTGAQADYAGAFKATLAGWYMVELAIKVNTNNSWGWRVAPVLYKGTALASTSAFKIGTDVMYAFWGGGGIGARYVQNSWIVYLNANELVRAGYNVDIGASLGRDILGVASGATGAETYFSMSLLNKSYA